MFTFAESDLFYRIAILTPLGKVAGGRLVWNIWRVQATRHLKISLGGLQKTLLESSLVGRSGIQKLGSVLDECVGHLWDGLEALLCVNSLGSASATHVHLLA